ncbi:RNA-binding cell elongation regulator Jag/EloR [Lacicoccus alkaliphilus]|uniref:RNA-binding protein KhpB n=1 Tax=Lacicoccus alkaliphilus DSM 16010 TaxID=1123231 RepID=A0A1M7GI18_9BACL|nr:RNA-binding cell elongation regulator Jag/EloR [Salinicoccus alkaliphilus]SHM15509.1 spoIIIJ-associated protein [Salinicoccus alkaliphilus DSM 16010]
MYKNYKAETVDHAIALGLEELKVAEEDVRIDVLEGGSKGFLGLGKKDAEVKLTIINPELKTYGTIGAVIGRDHPKEETALVEAVMEENRAEAVTGTEEEPVTAEETIPEDVPVQQEGPQPETSADESHEEDGSDDGCLSFDEAAQRTMEYIQDVITDMNIENDATYKITDNRAYIELESALAAKLIGKRGQTLNALQEVAQNHLNTIYRSYGMIVLDVENYRAKRRRTLENLAVNMSKKAIRTNQPVKLEPMPSFERKIMHNVLSGMDDINTYSEGNEPNRYLVIEKK